MRRLLGVIARADDGGLGSQTRELIEHLGCDVALVVLLGAAARGDEDPHRVERAMAIASPGHRKMVANPGPRLFDEAMDATLARCDVLYTIEGPYSPDLYDRCVSHGVELVIHANPELYRTWPCHRLLAPTPWRLDKMPPTAELVPFPVDCDRLRPSPRAPRPRLAHLTGPAMLDRQGTQLLLDALPHVKTEMEVVIRHPGPAAQERHGAVSVAWEPSTKHYWQAIPDGCWGLLQPRRYGGLSLCIQEAAARGLYTLALDREPESSFYQDVTWRCQALEEQPYHMAGGQVEVAEADPFHYADLIDTFVAMAGELGPAPREWAEAHSWQAMRDDYEAILR